MAKRRSKQKKRFSLPTMPSLPEFDWLSALNGLVVAAWVLGIGGLVTAWVLGVPQLEAYASAQPPGGEIEVGFLDPPSWAEGDLEASLVLTARQHISPDSRQRRSLTAARDALLATAWFDEIRQVRRVDERHVEIDARFAQPFAVIRDARGVEDHLVDPRGRLLPRSFPAGTVDRLTAIVGAGFDRPAQPAALWPGADVTAALKVLHLIYDRPWRHQVTQVDLASFVRDSTLRLVTDRGCIVVWGRAPGDETGGEVSAQQKLSYLDYHYQQYGHIDRGFLQELDVTGDVVIGR
jgi:hypothetical protein